MSVRGGMGGRYVRYHVWAGRMDLRVGFININDMYNNDVGKRGVYAYEAYEVQ
jgi:hypothetical protein